MQQNEEQVNIPAASCGHGQIKDTALLAALIFPQKNATMW